MDPWLHAVLQPLSLAAQAPSPLQYCWHEVLLHLDSAPQRELASAALAVGACLVAVGSRVVKPAFVCACGFTGGVAAWSACRAAQQPEASQLAPYVAVAAGALSLRVGCWAYPLFLFLSGCVLGGSSVFVLFTTGLAKAPPSSLLAGTVLAAMVFGIALTRWADGWWRLLTPIGGALLAAASLRFFIVQFIAGAGKWSAFLLDLQRGVAAVQNFGGATLWTSWAVLTLLGWYYQVGPSIGLWKPQPWLPASLHYRLAWALGAVGLADAPPAKAAVGDAEAARPLLQRSDSDASTLAPSSVGLPHLFSKTREAGAAAMKHNYRPEVALMTAVVTVVSLNSFLANQPVLFMGHAVLMSLAFLPLLSAGMVSYASTSLVLSRFIGQPAGVSVSRRHSSHAVFNGLALACALGGYACIYQAHKQKGVSQFGGDAVKDPSRLLHVWIGYLVLALMLVQSVSGIAKLYFAAILGEKRVAFHSTVGRLIYCLGAINQLIAYTFPGLLPIWATPLLAAMLMLTVGSTLFFLQEKHRAAQLISSFGEDGVARWLDARRSSVDKLRSIGSVGSACSGSLPSAPGSARGGSGPQLNRRESSALVAAEKSIERVFERDLLASAFLEWHRGVQRRRLEEAAEALEGQDRLVQFLSGSLVDAPDQ